MNYAFFSVWLALGFSGWIIACSGLSALQRYENHSGISDGAFILSRAHACCVKSPLHQVRWYPGSARLSLL